MDDASATAIVGLLIGFLVVGLIGTYIGDQMISATNLSQPNAQVSGVYQNVSAYTGFGVWTVPTGVTSATVIVVGAGGGGANANNASMFGGGGGGAGGWSSSVLTVTPGNTCTYYLGVRGIKNASGTSTNISCDGTTITAAGGAFGVNLTVGNRNGTAGSTVTVSDFIGASSVTSATAGTGNVTNNTVGGIAGTGLGGGGGGAGAQGIAGAGGHGGVQISYTTYTDETLQHAPESPLNTSMSSVINTFILGVLLCKILVIVSVASIVFILLQRTGLIPKFGE
jgi:hypothetical protein